MTLQLEERPNRTRRMRSSRWAWLAVLSAPILLFLTLVATLHFAEPWEEWPPWGDRVLYSAFFAPPITGVLLGLRSAWSGNQFGAHAAAVAIGWLTFWVAFTYLRGGPYEFAPSNTEPLRLSASAAVLTAAAVEAWYWLRWWRSRRGDTPRPHREVQH